MATEAREIKPVAPLPWSINPGAGDQDGDDDIVDANGEFVVDCYGGDPDGRYIVHAANCYPGLLAALKDMTPQMPPENATCHNGIVHQSLCGNCNRIAAARKAIAKAEGRNA